LLLAGPYAESPVEIEVIGQVVSRPYVDLTLEVMAYFGVDVVREDYHYYKIPTDQKYRSCPFNVEGDVSSASYFWAAAAVTGGTVTTRNIHPKTTRQGDIRLLEIFEKMGCHVRSEANRVTVSGGPLCGTDVDMNSMPDMVPTLAAVALFAEGRTIIKNVAHLRHKESDRLKAVAMEISRLGGHIDELPDGLAIEGGRNLHGSGVDSHDDHRLAMALAVVGLKVPGLVINNTGCVNKSFPRFWDLWKTLQ
jgi:3-phosphoshikimate 1-carboxyvinyltransferase